MPGVERHRMCAECAETHVAALTKSAQSDRFLPAVSLSNLSRFPYPMASSRSRPRLMLVFLWVGRSLSLYTSHSPHSSGVIPMQTPTISLAVRSHGLEDLIERARSYIHAAKAPATLRAYRADFEDFTRFCEEHNLPHLPATPTTVALYIADRASSLRSATITRRLTSITKAHQAAGLTETKRK